MTVDWGEAVRIGGVGFGVVFAVLIILAVAIWLVGLVVSRIGTGEGDTGDSKDSKKGA